MHFSQKLPFSAEELEYLRDNRRPFYAKNILKKSRRNNLEVPIFMGGKLNELTGETLPRDMTADLRELKIIPCSDVFDVLENLH